MQTNYSFATSLPAYHDRPSEKQIQTEKTFILIKKGVNNLLQLSEILQLPQSTIAGRVNDLIAENKVQYKGEVIYANRKRKKIVPTQVQPILSQPTMF